MTLPRLALRLCAEEGSKGDQRQFSYMIYDKTKKKYILSLGES